MSEVNNTNENIKNEENGVNMSGDSSIDLDALIHNSNNEDDENNASEEMVSEESPLDAAMKSKQNGIIVENDELVDDNKAGKGILPYKDNEERQQEYSEKIEEMEVLQNKAKGVEVIEKPTDGVEMAGLMDELDDVTYDDNGNVIVPENARYIRAKGNDEIPQQDDTNPTVMTENQNTTPSNDVLENGESKEEEKQKYRDSIVKIIIDKTGLGTNIMFDDEEKKVIEEAKEIHLVEVETQELKTITYNRPEENESFLDAIDKYQLSVSKAKMTFPGSGFKGEVTGLSYGEFADISLDTGSDSDDYLDFDKMYKKMSVVYSKLVNTSCGKFADFTDFLKKFAYFDLSLATYGLLIATQPEYDTISLRCNRESCKKGFDHKYATRDLIDFKSANTKYLEMIKNINEAAPEDYLKVADNSPVRKFKAVVLPTTKYIVELGLASCFDYLYGILDILKEYQSDPTISEDDSRLLFVAMLQAIRSISIPQSNGEYIKFTEPRQIVEILLRNLPPSDVKIVYSVYVQYTSIFEIEFSLKGIKCPHCGATTEAISITPDELVFQIHQLMLSTPVILDNFLDS